MGMTDSKEPSETGTTASETDDAKKKPYVPIADRPLLGVPEAEALTGVPAKIIRAQVRNGLLKARMAGSTTCASAAPTWTPGSTRCPPGTHKETPLASDCGRSGVLQNTIGAA